MNECSLKFAVITVSDRSARSERADSSGALAQNLLAESGEVVHYSVVPDGIESVQAALHTAIGAGANIVITSGGTGITRRDLTPQAVGSLLSYELPGIPRLIQSASRVPTAALSRSVAGVIDDGDVRAFVVCLPGSPNGVAEGVHVLQPLFAHIASQLADEDHEPALGERHHHEHNHLHTAHELHSPDSSPSDCSANHTTAAHTAATYMAQHHDDTAATVGKVALASVVDVPISMAQLEESVQVNEAGAVLSFCGCVRNHDAGEAVSGITYSAHPSAPDKIAAIAARVAREFNVYRVAVQHRYGHLGVGDVALGAAVSAAHRQTAFQALETLVELIKMELPVWKKQEFTDGTERWSGMA